MLEAIVFKKKKDGGWRPVKLGFARVNDKGQTEVFLDVIPAPNEFGYFKFFLQEQRDSYQRTEAPVHNRSQEPHPGAHGGASGDLDDTIPFAPQVD